MSRMIFTVLAASALVVGACSSLEGPHEQHPSSGLSLPAPPSSPPPAATGSDGKARSTSDASESRAGSVGGSDPGRDDLGRRSDRSGARGGPDSPGASGPDGGAGVNPGRAPVEPVNPKSTDVWNGGQKIDTTGGPHVAPTDIPDAGARPLAR